MLTKQYQCIVLGAPPKRQGIVETGLNKNPKTALVTVCAPHAPGAKIAKTGYSVLDTREGRSLLKIDLFTGRTHQIRVHMAYLGCPILGDDKYGDRMANRRYGADQLSLCASYLALHPQSGPLRDWPVMFLRLINPLRRNGNQ
jgi:23S rRNA pseudouridine1911/1915/1917 synthase